MPNRYEYSFIAASGANRNLADAAGDARALIGNAANVFNFLHSIVSDDTSVATDTGFTAILEMCGRAFDAALELEGGKLAAIEIVLRNAKQEEIEDGHQ